MVVRSTNGRYFRLTSYAMQCNVLQCLYKANILQTREQLHLFYSKSIQSIDITQTHLNTKQCFEPEVGLDFEIRAHLA